MTLTEESIELEHIVLVDDDEDMLLSLRSVLGRFFPDARIDAFTQPSKALEAITNDGADLVITDLMMPDMDGVEFSEQLRRLQPETSIVVLTGHWGVDIVEDLTELGVDVILDKPVQPLQLRRRIQQVGIQRRLQREVGRLREQLAERYQLIGESQGMRELKERLPTFASSAAPVLIEGESGTGKEIVARRIHDLSDVRSEAFVPVNCGALPEALVESELFGFRKGAFTGAAADTPGLIRRASGGSLFLDEVGELPLPVQVKLLRFMQEGVVRPVGGSREIPVRVRVIAATNRPLLDMVDDGSFRRDLYYRLRVLPVQVPPLREREEDSLLLARHFLRKHASADTKEPLRLSPAAQNLIRDYAWPGNVRELENTMRRIAVLYPGPGISGEELEAAMGTAGASAGPGGLEDRGPRDLSYQGRRQRIIHDFETEYVQQQLTRSRGNVAEAARLSGLDRKGFWRVMKRVGISPEDFRRG